MTGFSFDSNIIIDALAGVDAAAAELERAFDGGNRGWISRVAWIEVLSKGTAPELARAESFLGWFGMDEVDADIARRAAALRRERLRLRSADAIILATAQVKGRVLVTRNISDFPATLPGVRIPYLVQA